MGTLILKVLRDQGDRPAHIAAPHPARVDLRCDHFPDYSVQSQRATACRGAHCKQVCLSAKTNINSHPTTMAPWACRTSSSNIRSSRGLPGRACSATKPTSCISCSSSSSLICSPLRLRGTSTAVISAARLPASEYALICEIGRVITCSDGPDVSLTSENRFGFRCGGSGKPEDVLVEGVGTSVECGDCIDRGEEGENERPIGDLAADVEGETSVRREGNRAERVSLPAKPSLWSPVTRRTAEPCLCAGG